MTAESLVAQATILQSGSFSLVGRIGAHDTARTVEQGPCIAVTGKVGLEPGGDIAPRPVEVAGEGVMGRPGKHGIHLRIGAAS